MFTLPEIKQIPLNPEEQKFITNLIGTLMVPKVTNFWLTMPKPFLILKILEVVKHSDISSPIIKFTCLSEGKITTRTVALASFMDKAAFEQSVFERKVR